jgi:hypothetical protein
VIGLLKGVFCGKKIIDCKDKEKEKVCCKRV